MSELEILDIVRQKLIEEFSMYDDAYDDRPSYYWMEFVSDKIDIALYNAKQEIIDE